MPAKKTSKKTTTKTSRKTAAASRTSAKTKISAPYIVEVPKETAVKNPQALKVRKSFIFFIALIIIIGGLLYYFRGLFVAAVVNGQPISRLTVIHETEKQSGKQALNTLVRNTLIEQEAQKEHVTVSDQEVNDELKTVESNLSKQGQKLDQVLAMQGMTRDDLRKLVTLDKLVQKMVGKDIKISDKEVNDYINKNKGSE